MAVEIDELERSATAPGVIRLRSRLALRHLAVGMAAAAALFLTLWLPKMPQTPTPTAPTVQVAYWPGIPNPDGSRIDCFEPIAPEGYALLAVFRLWQADCQCLAWHVYEWEDGQAATELVTDDICGIALDVTDQPPVEQLLLVAIARNPDDLPRDPAQASLLLQCLEDATLPDDAGECAAAYASAAQACLPAGVTVVPQTFLVE